MAVAVVVGVVPAGCTDAVPVAGPVEVTTLALDAGGRADGRHAALSAKPIHLGAFASWYGQGEDPGGFDDTPTFSVPAWSTYLAVTGSTGCRVPAEVEVSRNADDLVVEFVGGVDSPTCARPVGPTAYLALPKGAADGVRTVNGITPVDPSGPGELVGFVPLGSVRLDPVPPVELGTPGVAELRDRLRAANTDRADEVTEALDRSVEPGRRGFAFVRKGCVETGAVLMVGEDRVTADLTGDDTTDCASPRHFLAVFTVDAAFVRLAG